MEVPIQLFSANRPRSDIEINHLLYFTACFHGEHAGIWVSRALGQDIKVISLHCFQAANTATVHVSEITLSVYDVNGTKYNHPQSRTECVVAIVAILGQVSRDLSFYHLKLSTFYK